MFSPSFTFTLFGSKKVLKSVSFTIQDQVAGYSCMCDPGWTDTNCSVNINCLSGPCQNGATCIVSNCQNLLDLSGIHFEVVSCTIYRVVSVATTVLVSLDGRVRTVILIPMTVS